MPTFDGVDYMESLKALEALLPIARRFAKEIGKELLGIWAAWETYIAQEDARLKAPTGLATLADIPFVVEAPTDGWETILAPRVFSMREFPHRPLPHRKAKRRVYGPMDNPRRIRAMWKKALGRPIESC